MITYMDSLKMLIWHTLLCAGQIIKHSILTKKDDWHKKAIE